MNANLRRATKERHDALVALLTQGVDGVETLAEQVGVSTSTVRRDLSRLAKEGRIARTYGGAFVRETFHERSFSESERINKRAKNDIAAVAFAMIAETESVFLDAGTTCLALARKLADAGPRTVYTRGLEAATLLARNPEITVVILGGQVRPLSHGVVGPLSALALERVAFDVAVLGADAVDPVRGLGEPTSDETWVKELAAARANRVLLLADASKLGPAAVGAWMPLKSDWTLVTDGAAAPEALTQLEGACVHVMVAP